MGGTACAGYWLGLSEQLSLDVKLDTAGPSSLAIYPLSFTTWVL
jgi:hypothetical protein